MNHLKDQIDGKKKSKKCVFHKQSKKKKGERKRLHNITEKKAVTA